MSSILDEELQFPKPMNPTVRRLLYLTILILVVATCYFIYYKQQQQKLMEMKLLKEQELQEREAIQLLEINQAMADSLGMNLSN